MEIKFDKKMIKKIAREYIFTNTSYRKLGENISVVLVKFLI